MGGGVCFTVFISRGPEQAFFSLDEVKLCDGAQIEIKNPFPVRRCENGYTSAWIPGCGQHCQVRDYMYLIGGIVEPYHPSYLEDPSNWVWSAPFPNGASRFGTSDSGSLTWTGCGSMLVGRLSPVVVPLPDDDKIFICGGASRPNNWVAIYNIRTGEFDQKDAPGYLCEERPNASFLWWKSDQTRTGNQHHQKEKPRIMVYYPAPPPPETDDDDDADQDHSPPQISHDHQTKLFSYDMEHNSWELFSTKLPAPRYEHLHARRTFIYVGGDILFIFDSLSFWFVFNLSLDKVVGKVELNGFNEKHPVFHAFCLDSSSYNVNVEDGSSDSKTFCLFAPDLDDDESGYWDIAYAKVRVQYRDEKYVAELVSKATLKVGWYADFSVFAGRTSRKRAAEEEE